MIGDPIDDFDDYNRSRAIDRGPQSRHFAPTRARVQACRSARGAGNQIRAGDQPRAPGVGMTPQVHQLASGVIE